ncbi:hypothetical protein ACFFKH_09615 [Micromonospora marina]|uniref:Uncharacterized protein n=1 Tax=Micromonospora marina TaxID=307120 RepID=A0A1C4XB65_9ACTN|nr:MULTISPECIES: hypothetical protein [Micromonospora]SCF05718.1 hypothetical protein GA0070215_10726 [Micromonospora marina]
MSRPMVLGRPRERDERPVHSRDVLSDEGIGWIGAHGGAGASTLTRLLGGVDIGCRWPDPAIGEPARVALVGRTNMDGLRAVSRALNAMREGRHPAGMRLVGVVLIADAPGRLPGPLLGRIRMLRSVAPVHRVPWVPSYRVGVEPQRPPRQLARLAALAEARPGRGSR